MSFEIKLKDYWSNFANEKGTMILNYNPSKKMILNYKLTQQHNIILIKQNHKSYMS